MKLRLMYAHWCHISFLNVKPIYFSESYIFHNTVYRLESSSKTEFRKPTIDGFNLEDVKRNGTVSAEISPISFLAGE